MVGRFIDYDGVQTNQPTLWFGHISIIDAFIKQSDRCSKESFIVDMHSRTGYSGSPVFVYRTIGSYFIEPPPGQILTNFGNMFTLLGIHFSQFPEVWELRDSLRNKPESETALRHVNSLSGMTCVCPAYAIREVLETAHSKVMKRLMPRAETAWEPPTTD